MVYPNYYISDATINLCKGLRAQQFNALHGGNDSYSRGKAEAYVDAAFSGHGIRGFLESYEDEIKAAYPRTIYGKSNNYSFLRIAKGEGEDNPNKFTPEALQKGLQEFINNLITRDQEDHEGPPVPFSNFVKQLKSFVV